MSLSSSQTLQTGYTVYGEGSPVILVHGVAASQYDWVSLGPHLAERGYQSYALDLLGHGDSPKPEDASEYKVERVYEHLAEWINGLGLSLPVFMVGHSLGGYLSLLCALRMSHKVRGLVLINPLFTPDQLSPFLKIVRRRPEFSAHVMRLAPLWMVDLVLGWDPISFSNFSPGARRQIAYDYKRTSPHFVHIAEEFDDLTPELPKINLPTLVIYGKMDLTLNPSSFPRLVHHLPNAREAAIERCGHQPHIGQPRMVNQMVQGFFDAIN